MTKELCQICDNNSLETIKEFSNLPRVTSDCKPWPPGGRLAICNTCGHIQKIPDIIWQKEINGIYNNFNLYYLSEGNEQLIFLPENETSIPRSKALINYITSTIELPKKGKLIDIGCGNGNALKIFSEKLPNWSLYGSEISDRNCKNLSDLHNFVKLYTDNIDEISENFNLISMIHSLEHIKDTKYVLQKISNTLLHNGYIFIEIPDLETSLFDIIVADHINHFTEQTLQYLIKQIGLEVLILSNKILPKELTFLGQRSRNTNLEFPNINEIYNKIINRIKWLETVCDIGHTLSVNKPFGIFGTAISGMWLYGGLRDHVDFFVDEDKSKIGKLYDSKPIISPKSIPNNSTVYIPLIPEISQNIAKRLSYLPVNFVTTV